VRVQHSARVQHHRECHDVPENSQNGDHKSVSRDSPGLQQPDYGELGRGFLQVMISETRSM